MAKDTKTEPKKGKIVIVMSGGCLSAVYCSDPNMEVDTLDWDDVRSEHGKQYMLDHEDEILSEKTEGADHCIL